MQLGALLQVQELRRRVALHLATQSLLLRQPRDMGLSPLVLERLNTASPLPAWPDPGTELHVFGGLNKWLAYRIR